MNFFSFKNKRDIYRIYASHTMRSVALSLISVYIPIFLLAHGVSLSKTIAFFIVLHGSGLLFAILICPFLIRALGPVRLLKISYPLEICFFALLNVLPATSQLFLAIAVVGGLATFAYWIPTNILLIRHTEMEKMGSDLASFFALPKVFGILGPLLGAAFIPFIGFWPFFALPILAAVPLLFLFSLKRKQLATPTLPISYEGGRIR